MLGFVFAINSSGRPHARDECTTSYLPLLCFFFFCLNKLYPNEFIQPVSFFLLSPQAHKKLL